MIRIGANPIGWSNDDMPELGGETPLEQCLAEAAAIGFEGMELGNKFPRNYAQLHPILTEYKLALVSGWYSTALAEQEPDSEWQAARAHAGLLMEMGCKVFIAAECTRTIHGDPSKPLSQRPTMSEDEWKRFTSGLTRFAERLRDEDGLTLVYHHHMGTVIQTEAEIDRMMSECGEAVHLLLDTGHITWAGGDPVALAKRYKDRIRHVHTKDVREAKMREAQANDWTFLQSVVEGVYTVPGDGMIDFVFVFKEIPDYSGWIVVEAEQDPAKANPKDYATLGFANLTRFIAEAGLKR